MRRRRRSRGYNLVAVVMLVTVLNVLVAAALPLWSTAIRRDKEEELISRGLQYAEAIRIFQKRFGRLPNRLPELLEVKPRSIRQLWEDPIAGGKKWRLIVDGMGTPVQPGGLPIVQGQGPGGPSGGVGDPATAPPEPIGSIESNLDAASSFGNVALPTGPIRGVKSMSDESSLKLFFGKSRYREWEFKVDLLAAAPVGAPGMPSPRINATVLGRPYRFPPPGGIPGATMPTGLPGPPGGLQPGGMPSGSPPQGPGVGIPNFPPEPDTTKGNGDS